MVADALDHDSAIARANIPTVPTYAKGVYNQIKTLNHTGNSGIVKS